MASTNENDAGSALEEKGLFDVADETTGYDYPLVFEDDPRPLYVNRYVLASISPVFRKCVFQPILVMSKKYD